MLLKCRFTAIEIQMMHNMCIQTRLTTQIRIQAQHYYLVLSIKVMEHHIVYKVHTFCTCTNIQLMQKQQQQFKTHREH